MSERMTPIPFKQLMTWIKEEHDNFGTVFGVNAPYVKKNGKTLPLFKEIPAHLRRADRDSLRPRRRPEHPACTEYSGRILCWRPLL